MKANKLVVAGLSLALSLSMVACNNKENTTDNNTNTTTEQNTADTTNNATNDYVERYSRFYGDNIGDLSMYSIYETPDTITEYYKTNTYPGNEKYVEELRAAYKDSRDKIQKFVNELKNDAKTEDEKIASMNEKLIAEGEKTISNIDARLKNLDNLPKDIYSKTQDDFIRAVDEATKVKNETYQYGENTDENAYVFNFNIEYKEDMDYQTEGSLILIHNGNKIEVASMSEKSASE